MSTKRWNTAEMVDTGRKLFAKIHRQKRHANPNHEVHFMARELDDWLVKGVESLVAGTYSPRHLKRYYFQDESVDQLAISDRILQHILLQQLKPTFPYVMNPNCYHLKGPTGVRLATERIRTVLQEQNPQYLIRADIKSFYKSIPQQRLLQDIKKHYADKKLQDLLEQIIRNPIDTPRGCKNPDHGIALRGPLSQFFSALYLKPLDDAFNAMQVSYIRYQDDMLILCKSLRQLKRCRKRMMAVLAERRLRLSSKKTRMGPIHRGFHFLGVDYPGTQPQDKQQRTPVLDGNTPSEIAHYKDYLGGGNTDIAINHQATALLPIVPHPRTFRKAREHIKSMVDSEVSPRLISAYLHRFVLWWVRTSQYWQYETLLLGFLQRCLDPKIAFYAEILLMQARIRGRSARGTPMHLRACCATA